MKSNHSPPSAFVEQQAWEAPKTITRTSRIQFVKTNLLSLILVSGLAVIPCFWHPRIEAGDLASHTYNAWLTQLVIQHKAPGLWIAPQKNNILFDILLFRLTSILGFLPGERVAVCTAVLIFVWGAFSLASTLSGRGTWFLLPLFIIFAQGWTMQMGFLNFYLGLGLSFIALAALYRGRNYYAFAALLTPLIWVAHPLATAWFFAIAIYLGAAKLVKPPLQWFLPVAALTGAFLLRVYLQGHYRTLNWSGHFYNLNGSDQLLLATSYAFLCQCLSFVVVGCVVLHLVQIRGSAIENRFPLPLQLFVVCFLGLSLFPDAIWLPGYAEPVSSISSRFTLAVGVLGCCALANLRPRLVFASLTTIIAICYFSFLYRDTGKIYAMEHQAEALTAQIPKEGRVIATIFPFRGSHVFIHHVVDRACIGRCFVIDNYEPASGQFRLRANPGNRVAASNSDDTNAMMLGDYVVTSEALPLWQIFQCGPWEIDLCLRPLKAGPLLSDSGDAVTRARKQDK
jgi:hypothetical protein